MARFSAVRTLPHAPYESLFVDAKGRSVSAPCAPAPLAETHAHLTLLDEPVQALVRAALAGVRLLVVPVDAAHEIGDAARWATPAELLAWIDEQVDAARVLLARCEEIGLVPPPCEMSGAPDLLDAVKIVVGAHPYSAPQFDERALAVARELLASPRAVGVGECGVDLGPHCTLTLDEQLPALRQQIRLAHELELPVQLHVRSADDDPASTAHITVAQVLREEGVPAAGCELHCCTSGPEVVELFAGLGCCIAFGGAATFARSHDIRAGVAACPQELLLSETDAPFMAPVPLRGAPCEPAMVSLVVERLAEVRAEAALGENFADDPAYQTHRASTYEALWINAARLYMPQQTA